MPPKMLTSSRYWLLFLTWQDPVIGSRIKAHEMAKPKHFCINLQRNKVLAEPLAQLGSYQAQKFTGWPFIEL